MAWAGWENYVPPQTRGVFPSSEPDGYAAPATAPKRQKFNARARCISGVNVGSEKEGRRVVELLRLQTAGEITQLEFHPKFELVVNGVLVGRFTPDSRYVTKDGELRIEDVKGGKGRKGTRTEAYSLRKRLFEALYAPLVIHEV